MNSLEKICKNNCYNEHYLDLKINTRVHQGTSRQGGANSENFKNSGGGV
jgi:hypothetical protein